MGVHAHHIRTVRIDVPLNSTCAYLFVDSEQSNWDPWWGTLFRYLLSIKPDHLDWRYEPVQDVYAARPQLTNDQRADLVRFLRTAPAQQVEEHRTLRRAVNLTPEQGQKVDLVYFSAGPGATKGGVNGPKDPNVAGH
jgi:hypothetical protein